MSIHHEQVLAMELNRSHIGKLVQIITESWSMTGTLTRVDQHDNREWELIYPERRLVPSGGEIYATLRIGPWTGDVIGNQPVTVETVKGTLEAPERAALKGYYPDGMGEDPPGDVVQGVILPPEPPPVWTKNK